MKSARHQLILLGFICQGLSFDDYLMPALSILLWVLCLKLPARPIRFNPLAEGIALAVGAAGGYALALALRTNPHFFIGHGITLVQAARLLRPLNRRERTFSIIAACVQIGVACTVVLDYRFIPLLVAALVLIPRALIEMEAEAFAATLPAMTWRPGPGIYAAITAAMILFFLVFPRGFLGAPMQAYRGGGDANMLDSMLDPARSAKANSGRVIFQIEGQQIGYLRCMALTDFDGQHWSADQHANLERIRFVDDHELPNHPYRRVRVKDIRYLGRVLPTDGRLVQIRGRFFRRPLRNTHDLIECDAIWNTPNNTYEYWIDPKPPAERISPRQTSKFLAHPAPSERLKKWLENKLTGVTDPRDQARLLETYFQKNFVYKLGAPELNRLNQIDDFMFNQREGHCERYASALALLLRMKQIPSRVVIGYVPNRPSWFSGWYNIRFKDAHAWTEAHFKNLGWVRLDATPRAAYELPGFEIADLMEAVDMFWYLNIVNFDAPTQLELLSVSVKSLGRFFVQARQNIVWIIGPVLLLLLVLAWRYYQSRNATGKKAEAAWKRNEIVAGHYYGQMLQALARRGFQRLPQQTPLEFFHAVASQPLPVISEMQFITGLFCSNRYGRTPITSAQLAQLQQALERIKTVAEWQPGNSGSADSHVRASP